MRRNNMNDIIKFNDIYLNIVENIEVSKGIIDSSLNWVHFENTGLYTNNQSNGDDVLCAIFNNGISPLTDVRGLDMYVQSVTLQVVCKQFENNPDKQQLAEIENTINTFINNYKTLTTKIQDITVLYNISEGYRIDKLDGNKVRVTLPFTITVIENATVTNDIKLYIGGEELFYTNMEFNRNGENSFNNVPGVEIKSFKNTTYTQLSLMGLWIKDNSVIDGIIKNDIIGNNVPTNQTYVVEMRLDDETIKTWKMYISSGKITGKVGAIIAYTMTLLEYAEV